MKTFLKWAGNKSQIKELISKHIDARNSSFIEPFVGSCAISLNIEAKNYILNDINPDLINLYKTILSDDSFVEYAKSFFIDENNSSEQYYKFRKLFNETKDVRLKSALFIYLNKHTFNGLCRYNKNGQFNSPYGRYKKPYFSEKEIIDFKTKFKNASFDCQDFRETMLKAKKNDVIYCDPPYVAISKTSNFTSYTKDGFNQKDQQDLMNLAEKLRKKGVTVIISNHDTAESRELYKDANKIESFEVQRYISCIGVNRNRANELLAVYSA